MAYISDTTSNNFNISFIWSHIFLCSLFLYALSSPTGSESGLGGAEAGEPSNPISVPSSSGRPGGRVGRCPVKYLSR
jgi:hypothetical protein